MTPRPTQPSRLIELYVERGGARVGTYDPRTKELELFRDAPTMLYADIDWIIVVGTDPKFQINPLRHAPDPADVSKGETT